MATLLGSACHVGRGTGDDGTTWRRHAGVHVERLSFAIAKPAPAAKMLIRRRRVRALFIEILSPCDIAPRLMAQAKNRLFLLPRPSHGVIRPGKKRPSRLVTAPPTPADFASLPIVKRGYSREMAVGRPEFRRAGMTAGVCAISTKIRYDDKFSASALRSVWQEVSLEPVPTLFSGYEPCLVYGCA